MQFKLIINITLKCFIILTFGCNQIKNYSNGININIIDSISIPKKGMDVFDFQNNNYLSYSYFDSTVYILDNCGIKDSLKKWGTGDSEYYKPRAFKFINDSVIVILTVNQLKFYNIKTKVHIKTVALWNKNYINNNFTVTNVAYFNEEIIYSIIKNGSWNNRDYFENSTLFGAYSIKNQTLKMGLDYPPQSIYHNNEEYYELVEHLFEINERKQTFYLLFPYDQLVYEYSLINFSIVNIIPIDSKHFGEIKGLRFNINGNHDKLFLSNSRYDNIKHFRESIFLTYTKGINDLTERQNFNKLCAKQEKYLLIINNNKFEIKLPWHFESLKLIKNNGLFVFKKKNNTTQSSNSITEFYLVNIRTNA